MTLENSLANATHAANATVRASEPKKKAASRKAVAKKTAKPKATAKAKAATKLDYDKRIKMLKAFDLSKFRGSRLDRAKLLKDGMTISEFNDARQKKFNRPQIVAQLLSHEMISLG